MKARSPAPVQYRLDASGLQKWGLLVVLAIEALLATLWILFQRQASYASWHFWVAVLLAEAGMAFLAWRSLQKLPAGWLLWTGAVWRLQVAAAESAEPTATKPNRQAAAQALSANAGAGTQAGAAFLQCALVFDGQSCMLLRLSQPAQVAMRPAVQWVWVSRPHMPAQWHALRSAVVWAQSASAAPDCA